MKKILVVFLALMLLLTGCSSGVAQAEYDALQAKYDDLKSDNDALEAEYNDLKESWNAIRQENIDLETQVALNTDASLFALWADLVSKKNVVYAANEETVIVIVYSEGRTLDEIAAVLKEKLPTYLLMLSSSNFPNSVLAVMNDNNEVWFGYNIPASGDATTFLCEKYVN